MSYFSLKAEFFVSPSGVVIQKAKPLSRSAARKIYDRDGWKCQNCGVPVRFGGKADTPFDHRPNKCGSVDHILPRSRGGQNDDSNLRLLCKSCNSQKGAK